MREVTLYVVCKHRANLEFWFSGSIPDMVNSWQEIEFSFVLPAIVFRFFVIPFTEEVPVELVLCVGVESFRPDDSVVDCNLIVREFRSWIPTLPITSNVCD